MSTELIWLIIAGAGAIQTFFLSVYIFFSGRIRKEERILLGLLLFAISVRITKSIGWYYFDITNGTFLNLGFAAHAFIGPFMVLYFRRKAQARNSVLIRVLMLLPSLLLLVSTPILTLDNFWYVWGYAALLYMTNGYLLYAAYLLWIIFKQKKIYFPWYRNLFIGVLAFCLSYFTNYIFGINPYITGPIVYSVIIYITSFILFSNTEIFTPLGDKRKYKNINLSPDQIAIQKEKIEGIMAIEKPYLNSDFSLTELSQLTGLPKHLLSRFFSENRNQSFTDYTNSYRVEHSKELLSDEKSKNLKIASIAYDAGFNSISSFNSAFKKFEGVTPSEFRKAKVKSIDSSLHHK